MASLAGHVLTLSALFIALGGAVACFLGGYRDRSDLVAAGRIAGLLVFGLITAACGVMIYALVAHDFSVKYVADVGSRQTPLYYTVISLWAALEGSILFWGFILSLYTALVVMLYRGDGSRAMAYAVGVLLTISSFFLFVMSGPTTPSSGWRIRPPTGLAPTRSCRTTR